jgi:hypothetical protein
MNPNMYIYEKLAAARHEELQHEMERSRMLASLPRQRTGQHAIASFGILLVKVGTWLKQLERSGEPAVS